MEKYLSADPLVARGARQRSGDGMVVEGIILRMKWPLPRRPLQAMASLHHLSLGPQNATLGSFAGVGFRRFGLESCWGSAVSQPRSTELLGAVSELCSREFFADEVATSTEAAPGNGIIASSFFRASERNVRHFCGRWFSQVWA